MSEPYDPGYSDYPFFANTPDWSNPEQVRLYDEWKDQIARKKFPEMFVEREMYDRPPRTIPGRNFGKRTQDAVWHKTSGHCWYCGKLTQRTNLERTHDTFSIDHQIPWSQGGTHHVSNLVAACLPCNISKGKKGIEAYRAWLSYRGIPHFTPQHIAYLESLNIALPPGFPCYPQIVFWGEEQSCTPEEH